MNIRPTEEDMDSVERYLEVFESLRRRKRWSTGVDILRFAALTLAASEVADPEVDLEAAAKALADEAGGFSPLGSAMRHAVAAILIRRGLDPVATVHRVKETRGLFKEFKLSRSGAHPVLAALILVLDADGDAPSRDTVGRVKEILDRWNEDHWFLTGVDDYPMAAMHATRDVSIEQLGVEVEEIYQLLRTAKFSSGEQLQLASHLLALSDQGPKDVAQRFERTAKALKESKQRVWQSHYDEVALLVLSGGHVDEVVPRVVEYRDRLRAVKPRPTVDVAFSIAAGVVLAQEAERLRGLEEAATAANLRAVQAIIEAQQAAMVACLAACTVTTAAAASTST
jgi:hypothetical protein